jgi:hypothetical protein
VTVAVVWAHVESKKDCLQPLAALAGVGEGMGAVMVGVDRVVVVVEV